jgi:phage terminase small subunit
MARKLTEKQRRFAEAYLKNGRNAAQAYRTAYNTKGSPQLCAERAYELIRHPLIAAIIAEADAKAQAATQRVIDQYAVNEERVVAELARLGFSNMADYMRVGADGDPHLDFSALTRDQAAALAEVTVEDFRDGRGEEARDVRRVRFKLSDKRAALELLGKKLGMFKEKVAHEITGRVTFVVEG